MKFARVTGTVVATRKYEGLEGVKLLVVQPLDEDLKPIGRPQIAAD
ncbi:MAG: EutN/CcmL family microcompartment protein, partial [Chloroflexi bacterium]|nr:EutN/CcmL family microcompartment protein [Chloroflexota bacterium]